MAVPSEVRRVQAAIQNRNGREMEWSLWYARMRQSVPSARPPDVKYWSAVEAELLSILEPPKAVVYPTRKKRPDRGLSFAMPSPPTE